MLFKSVIMSARDVQSIENVVQNKLFLSDIRQIYQLIKQGTAIRLVL